ncbi:MAG: amidohydrolase family protein [Acidimicrobiales bacterium]
MPIIDMHAHVTPERYKAAIRTKGHWHGLDDRPGELDRGGFANPISQRLAEMDELGVDMQLVTPTVGFYQYDNALETTKRIHRECNDEIAELVEAHPTRFAGLAMVPMQDPASAIAEMERAMTTMAMKGVVISDHVGDRTYDQPEFLPFFRAAEELGAILFFHQGGGDTCVSDRISRFGLPNAVGNLAERTLAYATLVFSGVIDRHPGLKPLLAHGGGYVPYGVARMDKIAGAFEGAPDGRLTPPFGGTDFRQQGPPSDYLDRFHYDCCTYSGPVLRFLIDTVGIDQVVLGTDYPAPMFLTDAVNWIRGLPELTDGEKQAILETNPTALLDM